MHLKTPPNHCYLAQAQQFRWDLKQTLSLQLTIGATAVACPWIIFLNILVILAIKKVRELHKNSNILITNLAVTDLLVGAVSMPLSITVDALILQGTVSHSTIYLLSEIGVSVLITLYTISYRHLLLIAWERYVAIVKWTEYKALVTKGRMKKYTLIVWMESVTYMALHQALVWVKFLPRFYLWWILRSTSAISLKRYRCYVFMA